MGKEEIKKQGIGLSIMLVGVLIATFITCFSEDDVNTENIIMLIVMFLGIVVAVFGARTMAIVVIGIQVASFIAFKVYAMIMMDNSVAPLSFLWILAPVLAMIGMIIFCNALEKIKIDNQVLVRQVKELSIIDAVTGLYNLRGLFMDIQTQISYAERNGNAISLMIVKLRYPKEMKAVLKQSQYEEVVKRLSTLLCDTVRLEDKVYSIDEDGKFAIVLTCDMTGTKIVEKRMRGKLEATDWLAGIAQRPIRGDVKIGYRQYEKAKFNRDVNSFLESVEEEVEYDV